MHLLCSTLLLHFVLEVIGQYRKQVDGDASLTLIFIQVVHHTGRKGEGTGTHRSGRMNYSNYGNHIICIYVDWME